MPRGTSCSIIVSRIFRVQQRKIVSLVRLSQPSDSNQYGDRRYVGCAKRLEDTLINTVVLCRLLKLEEVIRSGTGGRQNPYIYMVFFYKLSISF
ncbi:hypothetical protein FEM48_Zijuj12G0026500 [Ziziphus jujuba var. spinosa]|uniref:Uncharacterized protein n=1 Tax=Ziziphus jujuba var. spinosa TaxID=714518 RepID=A0A978UAQ8_ZIZJJ|nr:hypothetical protein FEM48_Zijuj12G0026500 [Ziziphus jujuba var. spinosa]